jgi:hypothetical protein
MLALRAMVAQGGPVARAGPPMAARTMAAGRPMVRRVEVVEAPVARRPTRKSTPGAIRAAAVLAAPAEQVVPRARATPGET